MSDLEYCNKFFYKYRPIDGNTDRLLRNNELYFSHSGKLNDPFDCKLDYFCKYTLNDFKESFRQMGVTSTNVNNLIKEYLNIGIIKEEKDGFLLDPRFFSTEYNPFRICCFSETNKSLLMWGHYAKNHEGICLKFKSLSVEDNFLLPTDSNFLRFRKVNYCIKKPQVKLFNRNSIDLENIVEDFIITKFRDWKYEREHRLLAKTDDLNGNSTINFRKDALEGIIFGLKVSRKDALYIKQLVDKNYTEEGINVKLYRTEEAVGKYAINIKKIKDFDKYIELLK
jgi:hypothetical protein